MRTYSFSNSEGEFCFCFVKSWTSRLFKKNVCSNVFNFWNFHAAHKYHWIIFWPNQNSNLHFIWFIFTAKSLKVAHIGNSSHHMCASIIEKVYGQYMDRYLIKGGAVLVSVWQFRYKIVHVVLPLTDAPCQKLRFEL